MNDDELRGKFIKMMWDSSKIPIEFHNNVIITSTPTSPTIKTENKMKTHENEEKVRKLIKRNRFEILEDESTNEYIEFKKENMIFWVSFDESDDLQFGVQDFYEIDNPEEKSEVGSSFFDRFDETGDLKKFEEFLDKVYMGKFDYIQNMYYAFKMLRKRFKDHEDDFDALIEDLI